MRSKAIFRNPLSKNQRFLNAIRRLFIVDIDKVVAGTRAAVRSSKSIDIDDKYSDVSIVSIMADISREKESLKSDYLLKSNREGTRNYEYTKHKEKVSRLRAVDRRLQSVAVYREHIRPAVVGAAKKRYLKYEGKRVIDAGALCVYNGEEFVNRLYEATLKRQPEEAALSGLLKQLSDEPGRKIAIIKSVAESQEAQQNDVALVNYKWKLFKYRAKKFIVRIPVLGYLARLAMAIIRLPRTMRELTETIRVLNEKTEKLAEKERCLDAMNVEFSDTLDKIYLDYEHFLMHKPRETVKNLMLPYLDRMNKWAEGKDRAALKITDIGCGFGEWIELLNENGYNAKGVDSNKLIVGEVKQLFPHYDIEINDCVKYLREAPSESLDVISSHQMIEHLDLPTLFEFFKNCNRVLKKGGLLVLSTPNPQNLITATYMFNVDPTHKRPLPYEIIEFYLREWDFDIWETFFVNPMNFIECDYERDHLIKDMAYRFNLEQDISVWGVKR